MSNIFTKRRFYIPSQKETKPRYKELKDAAAHPTLITSPMVNSRSMRTLWPRWSTARGGGVSEEKERTEQADTDCSCRTVKAPDSKGGCLGGSAGALCPRDCALQIGGRSGGRVVSSLGSAVSQRAASARLALDGGRHNYAPLCGAATASEVGSCLVRARCGE